MDRRRDGTGMRTLATERPFTPFNAQRHFFGPRLTLKSPLLTSLRHVRFFEIDALPNLPSMPSLFQKTPTSLPNITPRTKLCKLPAIRKTHHCKQLFSSLDNLLEELENQKDDSSIPSHPYCAPKCRSRGSLTSSRSLDAETGPRSCTLPRSAGNPSSEILSISHPDNPTAMEPDYSAEDFDPAMPNQECFIKRIQDVTDLASFDNCINEARALGSNQTSITSPRVDSLLSLEKILSELKSLDHENIDEIKTLELFSALYLRLKEEGLTSRYCPHSKLKSKVLRNIYSFVENGTDPVLLEIAHISLALKVKGPNVSSVCKLIFKVTRSAKNDELFLHSDILDLFIESLTTPLEDPEALIYAYGALKFLTMNPTLLQSLLDRGVLQLMVLHLKLVNTAHEDGIQMQEQTSHAIFQLTGTLRHVADAAAHLFVSTGALQELCVTLRLFSGDIDLVANIARTISILSVRKDCASVLLEYGMLPTFIELFNKFPGRSDIVIRLAYSLGNILECSSVARFQLFEEPNAFKVLIGLIASYMQRDFKETQANILRENKQNGDSSQDVMVKLVRVIVNMATEPDVGSRLVCEVNDFDEATYYDRKDECLEFIHILLAILNQKSPSENEEIVVAILTALNNLTFYSIDGPLSKTYLDIAQGLSSLIRSNHVRCLIEVTRVLGNLTRCHHVRQLFLDIGGLAELTRWLSSTNDELLYNATGLLVNLLASQESRLLLKESDNIDKLVLILERRCENNWNLATLICQALWNFASDASDIHSAFGPDKTPRILSALMYLLDEDKFFPSDVREGVVQMEDYQNWDCFAEIAANLLEKLE
ncbi:unnamed protein product [Bemisia tabaci]|uniref:Armadillo repeat-containing protein 2 n=2 Tax=Bemisia tabaci TaxID=7038 RepID=A0A9P0CDL0_BEMTA|nr:unnamed protein product [Bemisia tabaci]